MSAPKFCTGCGAPTHGEPFCTGCGRRLIDEPATVGDTAAPDPAAHAGPIAGPAATAVAQAPAQSTAGIHARSGTAPPPGAPPPVLPGASSSNQQAPPASKTPWTSFAISGGIVLGLAVIVGIVLITTGGRPPAKARPRTEQTVQLTNSLLASRQLYASTQQPSYSALLPAGWQQASTTASDLTGEVTVQSPVDGGAKITVGQIAKPTKTLRSQAAELLHTASSGSGFHQDASQQTSLAGGRSAWVLAYDAGGQSTAAYLVHSCSNTYAVSATVPPSRVSLLRARIAIVAGTLQGNC